MSKKMVPVIVAIPVVGGGGGGHFLVRLLSPVDDGLPGSLLHCGIVLPEGMGSCAFDTVAMNGDIASASTTNEPRMGGLLFQDTRKEEQRHLTRCSVLTVAPHDGGHTKLRVRQFVSDPLSCS
jgi:hypothetical protein